MGACLSAPPKAPPAEAVQQPPNPKHLLAANSVADDVAIVKQESTPPSPKVANPVPQITRAASEKPPRSPRTRTPPASPRNWARTTPTRHDSSPWRRSEAGSVFAHPLSTWQMSDSDMDNSTDCGNGSALSSPAGGFRSETSPLQTARKRALFGSLHEAPKPGQLVSLQLAVLHDDTVAVDIRTADAFAVDVGHVQLLHHPPSPSQEKLHSLLRKVEQQPSPQTSPAAHPPPEPQPEPRPQTQPEPAAAEADEIERPGTPDPLDSKTTAPEKTAPLPPGARRTPDGLRTPDLHSRLRPTPPKSPGSFGGYIPPPPNTLVLYTTSLRVVRSIYQESQLARGLLDSFCYVYIERDVSMSRQFQEELKARLPDGVPPIVPCLYYGDVYVGDYPHMCRLAEVGDFDYALDSLGCRRRDVAPSSCQMCYGLRFVVCSTCRGGKKLTQQLFPDDDDEYFGECPDCNENGTVQCECTMGTPPLPLARQVVMDSP